MTAPTRLFDQAASHLQRALDGLRGFGTNARAATWGLRQEVPFERWFADHGFLTPIETPHELNKARAWALYATLEGVVRTIAQTASYVYSLYFGPSNDGELQLEILKAQWQGIKLSAHAVFSPNAAKERVCDSQGASIIGASLTDWRWGTRYSPSS